MENCISINLKQKEILIKISDESTQEEIIECLNEKLEQLSKMYQDEKIPILVSGKVLKQKEMEEIEKLIKENIDVKIKFDYPAEMGLSEIKKVYEKNTDVSETKFYRGSLRSGQKIETEGSVVIIGDVNAGAEVIAGENIIVVGILRGLAHAGAKGNAKAVIASSVIESTQLRIANLVKEMEKDYVPEDKRFNYAYVKDNAIVLE